MSCSVPVLGSLYGGLDDCLLAVYHCLQSFRGFPFIVFTDSYNRNRPNYGQQLAAFVAEKKFGTVTEGPVKNGMHHSPVCVWIWESDSKQKNDFVAYMNTREAEFSKKYEANNG